MLWTVPLLGLRVADCSVACRVAFGGTVLLLAWRGLEFVGLCVWFGLCELLCVVWFV